MYVHESRFWLTQAARRLVVAKSVRTDFLIELNRTQLVVCGLVWLFVVCEYIRTSCGSGSDPKGKKTGPNRTSKHYLRDHCNTHMLNGGHLKLLCKQCLEFFYFHSSQEAILLCGCKMYNGRVQHIVDHVKKLLCADPNPHAWWIDLVTCLLSLRMQVKQEIAFNKVG